MAAPAETADQPPAVEIIDESKNTNLHLLALKGDHVELARFAPGAKVDAPNVFGLTALMFAARYGRLEAVKALLDLRADASKTNKYGGSVFLMAAASGNLDVVNILLQHLLSGGVSRQALETHLSPIAISILFGHEHVFKFLVGSKFNVRAKSLYTDLTPLMFAALSDNPVFKQHLLLMGADPRVRNANNQTCHDMERRFGGASGPDGAEEPPAKHQQPPLQLKIPQIQAPLAHPSPAQRPQQHSPVIIVSPRPQPTHQIYNPFELLPLARKSSNTMTPNELTPMVSPVGFYPQVFFPADFTPSQFASPTYLISRTYSPYQDFVVSPVYDVPSPFLNMNITNDVYLA